MSKTTTQAYTAWQNEAERERILLEQLPQVRYIARRIHERLPRHVPLEDLVHAGVIGLIDALHKYDRGKQVQFPSYAKFRIRGAILDSLREMDWSPRELRRKARHMEETHSRLSTELGRSPSEPELAAALGMDLQEFQRLLGQFWTGWRSAACGWSRGTTATRRTSASTCPMPRRRRRSASACAGR